MKDQVPLSGSLKVIAGIFIVVGLVALVAGFILDPERTWANYLLNNYYFLMLDISGEYLELPAFITFG